MVEVADAVHLPVSTDYPQCWGRLHRVVVYYEHFKGPGAACVPMQQDVTGATVVEVADAVHDPVQTGRADIELGLHPTRVHLIDQEGSRPRGRTIHVDEKVG